MSLRSPKILFHREFQGFTGGHLKVWDYYNHVIASRVFSPDIVFSPNSKWNEENPWYRNHTSMKTRWPSENYGAIFLAGMDWKTIDTTGYLDPGTPVINLIQGMRHADPRSSLYQYLQRPAIRICVSPEVQRAIKATGQVNGPVFMVPNGIDGNTFPQPLDPCFRQVDLFIAGPKQPTLAKQLAQHFYSTGYRIQVSDHMEKRVEFLKHVNRAKATLFLPLKEEGFYLPALEGMALQTLVICPDCVGNRSYCRPNVNCLMPIYEIGDLIATSQHALTLSPDVKSKFLRQGASTVSMHGLLHERNAFLRILENLDELWQKTK